ncbi:hypothetical protein M569_15370, partial [Genlisea aurea]
MECVWTRNGSRCGEAASRRCDRCRAVGYCSLSHQVSHRSIHKIECDRFRRQMNRADVLSDFPFTFYVEPSKVQVVSFEKRCSFLARHGVHGLGMWICECSCGSSLINFDTISFIPDWLLSSELCPCNEPSISLQGRLSSWKDYCEWRHLPLSSPAAVILHWPLTVYWAIQLATGCNLLPEIKNELRIHYLGPEKELLQLAAFGELQALFPGVRIYIDFVGPAIPDRRSDERIDLHSYALCNDTACRCKTEMVSKSQAVRMQLHAGFYHDRYGEFSK